MAWIECNFGSGLNPLIRVYESTGATVTATNGTVTITASEVSTGVYEIEIPSFDTWTVKKNGTTLTTFNVDTVKIYTFESVVTISVDLYSASEDTVTFTDLNGSHTALTDTDGVATVSMTVLQHTGTDVAITSSVAKDPANLSNYYSTTKHVNGSTTEVFAMPDNTLFWYGYYDSAKLTTFGTVVFGQGYAIFANNDGGGIASTTTLDVTKARCISENTAPTGYAYLASSADSSFDTLYDSVEPSDTFGLTDLIVEQESYIGAYMGDLPTGLQGTMTVYALWCE